VIGKLRLATEVLQLKEHSGSLKPIDMTDNCRHAYSRRHDSTAEPGRHLKF